MNLPKVTPEERRKKEPRRKERKRRKKRKERKSGTRLIEKEPISSLTLCTRSATL